MKTTLHRIVNAAFQARTAPTNATDATGVQTAFTRLIEQRQA